MDLQHHHKMAAVNNSEKHEVYKIFFMIKDRRIDPEIDEGTSKFFNRLVWTLIVLNLLIGIPTIYYEYFYEETPKVIRDISILPTSEI